MSGAVIRPNLDDKVCSAIMVAAVVKALAEEGVSSEDALTGVGVAERALLSPATRVSPGQIIACYRNARRLSRDPFFAFHVGLRLHVSSYGMYGFAILSTTDFRRGAQFAVQYQVLAAPLVDIAFVEESRCGIWKFAPLEHPHIDPEMSEFIVEMQLGTATSLHRDVMGSEFVAREIQMTFPRPDDARIYADAMGCPVKFGQPENRLIFDAALLDRTPALGNDITFRMVVELCDGLVEELKLRIGVVGKVRGVLLHRLMRPTTIDVAANDLNMSVRTLRRKLKEENTSFRTLVAELRMNMAMKYLRETDLKVEDIAYSLGFSDAANFRHAFLRWTKVAPKKFREQSGRT